MNLSMMAKYPILWAMAVAFEELASDLALVAAFSEAASLDCVVLSVACVCLFRVSDAYSVTH